MSAYKDNKRGTWTSKFAYLNWKGERKWVTKRGFATKRDAQKYESEFLLNCSGDMDMLFEIFVEKYREELYPRIKLSTQMTKDNMIDTKILPYFGKRKINEITRSDVVKWQNEMLAYRDEKTGKPFAKSYLKALHSQLSAILGYAVRYYGLKENVALIVGNMGTNTDAKFDFWTLSEYKQFRKEAMAYPLYYYCYEVLYFTGIREGELLALTAEDVDLENCTININKTYSVIKGEECITDPKTKKSKRIVSIPQFLADEIKDYAESIYGLQPTDRLFITSKTALGRKLKEIAASAGVKPIRIHDLRHSHISLLINEGYSAVAIGERVGHESAEITFRYSHMFPSVQDGMVETLEKIGRLD